MVVDGPLAIIRFGSCGSIISGAQTGDIIVGDGAFGITRNYAYFDDASEKDAYVLWPNVDADTLLTEGVVNEMVQGVGAQRVFRGLVGNADSFYGSQGRPGADFYDANEGLLDRVRKEFPQAAALEMESHMLFHLARVSTGRKGDEPQSVRAACALMVFADREGNSFISPEMSRQMTKVASLALLDALVKDMPTQAGLHPAEGSVWQNNL
ncbi:hypothetical protein LPJ62_003411 [Coemansia sp. RSA 2167]|nr:hypothetical protein LPJ62_003411 [Coemansia sp. RSA 2167]